MKIQQRLIGVPRPFFTALLAGSATLVLGLAACSPTETATNTTPDAGGEVTATDDGAAEVTDAGSAKFFAKDGVAIQGADPVAYFTESAFVEGSSDYTHEWQGVIWQFASAENRDQFAANPEQFAPEYGGYCAWAVAARNSLVPIDPNAWRVVDGKLYLNANKRVQGQWEKDISGFIEKADQNWPELAQS